MKTINIRSAPTPTPAPMPDESATSASDLAPTPTPAPMPDESATSASDLAPAPTPAPVILPEHAPPADVIGCDRCGLIHQRTRMVWGEGNPKAPIFILLDNPGAREDKEGTPYVCGTRIALQQCMAAAGLPLDQIYVTYLLKHRPIRAYDKDSARQACFAHVQYQLAAQQPRMILGLGNVVAQALFPDQEADVKNMRGRWHISQGFPTALSYHPLAVRRRPVLMKYLIEDLAIVAAQLSHLTNFPPRAHEPL